VNTQGRKHRAGSTGQGAQSLTGAEESVGPSPERSLWLVIVKVVRREGGDGFRVGGLMVDHTLVQLRARRMRGLWARVGRGGKVQARTLVASFLIPPIGLQDGAGGTSRPIPRAQHTKRKDYTSNESTESIQFRKRRGAKAHHHRSARCGPIHSSETQGSAHHHSSWDHHPSQPLPTRSARCDPIHSSETQGSAHHHGSWDHHPSQLLPTRSARCDPIHSSETQGSAHHHGSWDPHPSQPPPTCSAMCDPM